MAEETATAPAADDAEPQVGETPAAPAADEPAAPALDPAVLARELASARREAAGYRTKLRTYEERDKTDAEKSADRIAELERENAELRTTGQQAALRSETYAVASRLGFRNPSIAFRMIDPASVSYAEDGSPRNVAALLEQVVKADPYLTTATTDFGGGPRGAPPAGEDMNELIRRRARGH